MEPDELRCRQGFQIEPKFSYGPDPRDFGHTALDQTNPRPTLGQNKQTQDQQWARSSKLKTWARTNRPKINPGPNRTDPRPGPVQTDLRPTVVQTQQIQDQPWKRPNRPNTGP